MPVINYQGTKLDTEQKKQLTKRLTDTAVEITGAPAKFVTVVIQEFEDDNLGIAGETVAEIKVRSHQ